jgi:hypothetical protein
MSLTFLAHRSVLYHSKSPSTTILCRNTHAHASSRIGCSRRMSFTKDGVGLVGSRASRTSSQTNPSLLRRHSVLRRSVPSCFVGYNPRNRYDTHLPHASCLTNPCARRTCPHRHSYAPPIETACPNAPPLSVHPAPPPT